MRADDRPRPTVEPPFTIFGRLLGEGRGGAGPDGPSPGAISVGDGVIVARASGSTVDVPPGLRLRAAYVAPGLVDLQVNGAFGHEVGADPAALRALAEALPATGVTAFLPTLISRPEAEYAACFAAVDEERAAEHRGDRPRAARILGLHLEGPLLALTRAGAHPRGPLDAATADLVLRIADPRRVRLVTLAPERDGALALIAALRARGIAVSLGHTDATFEIFTAAVDAGATLATHVWNAMSPFHHRAPGATGAALSDDRVIALAIADGVHTHPAAFRVAARAKGPGRLALVTDAIAGAGLGPGQSQLTGRPVTVDATSARLADGTLAGSTLTQDQAMRNAMRFASLSIEEAIQMAAVTPRAALAAAARETPDPNPGPNGGDATAAPRGPALSLHAAADLVLLDEDFSVRATFVGGHLAT